MIKFDLDTFLFDLCKELSHLNTNIHVNDQLETLRSIFRKVVNKYAPLRKASRQEKHLHAKPWLTPNPGTTNINTTQNYFFQ